MAAEATTEQLLARAKEAYARNAYLAALGDLQLIVEQRPDFPDVRNLMGLCLSLLGRTDEALEAFGRAVELNPGYVEAHLNRAITMNHLGRIDEARESFAARTPYIPRSLYSTSQCAATQSRTSPVLRNCPAALRSASAACC